MIQLLWGNVPTFRQVGQLLLGAQDDQLHAVGDQGLQDVVTVREHLANRVVGFEQGLVARLAAKHGKLARPSELRVVRIDLEPGVFER